MSDPTGNREPIWMECEGSGGRVHRPGRLLGMCSMCGNILTPHTDGIAHTHRRKDVIAMLQRGDFG